MNKENNTQVQTIKVGKQMDAFVNQRIVQLQQQLLAKEIECENLKQQNEGKQQGNRIKLMEIKQETLSTENHQLKQQISQYETLNRTLQKKCESFSTQLEQITSVLEETQTLLERERQQKQQLQLQSSSNNMDVNHEKAMIKQQLEMLRRDKQQLQKALSEQERCVVQSTEQNNELIQLKHQVNQYKQQVQECNNTITNWESKYSSLEYSIKMQQSHTDELRTLRSQVIQAQKDKNVNSEQIKELEIKVRLQTEHALKLQNILNEKTSQLSKYQQQLSIIENLEEDNQLLQQDLEKMSTSLEDMQSENQRIAKYQQQKIEQLTRDIRQTSSDNQKKDEEIIQLKYRLQELEQSKHQSKQQEDEYNELKEFQQTWSVERDNYQRKINMMSDEIDKISKQQFDQVRLQVEAQLQMKHSQDKLQMENHIWNISNTLQDLQSQIEMHITRNSQQNIEIEQLKEQLNDKQNTSKTVLILEGQLRNQCIEIEKLKNILQQRSQELEQLRYKCTNLEGCTNYANELERKVQSLMNDNQRLNSIIIERCKTAW